MPCTELLVGQGERRTSGGQLIFVRLGNTFDKHIQTKPPQLSALAVPSQYRLPPSRTRVASLEMRVFSGNAKRRDGVFGQGEAAAHVIAQGADDTGRAGQFRHVGIDARPVAKHSNWWRTFSCSKRPWNGERKEQCSAGFVITIPDKMTIPAPRGLMTIGPRRARRAAQPNNALSSQQTYPVAWVFLTERGISVPSTGDPHPNLNVGWLAAAPR